MTATFMADLAERTGRIGRLPLVGGALCLDFANTVTGRHEGEREQEYLLGYPHLLAFAIHAGGLDAAIARTLLARAARDEAGAARVADDALALRENIRDVLGAIAHRRTPPRAALDGFNRALSEALRHACVVMGADGLAWGWDDLGGKLDSPLWPVLRSAADLLTSGRYERLKQCPFPHCGWLFFDHSKNNSRRWCEMRVCGNRTKARRHYMREKRALA